MRVLSTSAVAAIALLALVGTATGSARSGSGASCAPRRATGVRARQEPFVGRSYGAYGARSVISFVRLTVDASSASRTTTVRLVPWKRLAHTAPDRLALGNQTRLIVSDGAQFVDGVVRYV